MAVYVDESRWPFGRMIMCHMYADTPEELHQMADAIGIRRRWFQRRRGFPHYDICKAKRAAAVRLGAIEHTNRQLFNWSKEHKAHLSNEEVWCHV